MVIEVPTLIEGKRGCGYRKPKGIYLVSDGISSPCGRMPIPLDRCPCCGGGIKATRGWQTVDADALFASQRCGDPSCSAYFPDGKGQVTTSGFNGCPASGRLGKAGLLWIGSKFYPTPKDWSIEAQRMGVSRRIPAVPKDFVLGETWVLVAHRECITRRCDCGVSCPNALNPNETVMVPDESCPKCHGAGEHPVPGVFHLFKPTAIQYVVKGDETAEDLEKLVRRGLTPVKVEPMINGQPALDLGEPS